MSKDDKKRKLTGPWRNIHTAVWLIGLAILAWKSWWWPGILVLVAVSMIVEAVLAKMVPDAFEADEPEPAAAPVADVPQPPPPAAAAPGVHPEGLPAFCPKCGAPIRGQEVKWTGLQPAECPFCSTPLPLLKNKPGAGD
ncbi:MAG: hypothetical protein IT308_09050 [Anaerolineaceae bacterium]|nr:hypothetical protein [Anaerolineaceae bacterium]